MRSFETRLGSMACLALLACAPADAPPAAAPVASPAAAVPRATEAATPVEDAAPVAGAWDVASFEGYEPRRLSGTGRAAIADFHPGGVALRIECNSSGRSGTVSNGRFVRGPEQDAIQTAMGCGREREARDSRYFAFFEQNPTVERLGPDRLRLRTARSELILERPALRRLRLVPAPGELEGEWRMLELTRYLPEGGYTGIGLSEVPGRIVVSGDRLFYSRCPQYGLTFRWGEGGKLEKAGGTPPAGGAGDCRELNEPAPGYELPAAADVLALLHSSPAVERTGDGALLLSTDRLGLLITKARCEDREQSENHRTTRIVDCASPR